MRGVTVSGIMSGVTVCGMMRGVTVLGVFVVGVWIPSGLLYTTGMGT
jgi:hypothetical protein